MQLQGVCGARNGEGKADYGHFSQVTHRSHIVAIVPISLSAPARNLPYVVQLSKNYHPKERDDLPCWAKCDMVLNIGLYRLEGFKIGRRKWDTPQASPEDLHAVRKAVLHGLGVHNFTE